MSNRENVICLRKILLALFCVFSALLIFDSKAYAAVSAAYDVGEDKGDVLNILLIGTDERSEEYSEDARGDGCMLVSLNTENGTLSLVSFERAMGVPILDGEFEGEWDWLTHTFRYGGAELMTREIEECFDIDIDFYLRANFSAFEQLIDAIGGVDIQLTEDEANGLNGEVYTNARTNSKVQEGVNHLNGYNTLQYCRLRFIDDDWHRIERQRNTVQAIFEKCKNLSVSKFLKLAKTTVPLVETDASLLKVCKLLRELQPDIGGLRIQQQTIPAEETYGSRIGMGGRVMFDADFEKNTEILQKLLYQN